MLGTDTPVPELTHVSHHELWPLLDDEEFFPLFELFPWFHHATIEHQFAIERPPHDHLYRPRLDVDLAVQFIRYHSVSFPVA
jgi:hypothetical protein